MHCTDGNDFNTWGIICGWLAAKQPAPLLTLSQAGLASGCCRGRREALVALWVTTCSRQTLPGLLTPSADRSSSPACSRPGHTGSAEISILAPASRLSLPTQTPPSLLPLKKQHWLKESDWFSIGATVWEHRCFLSVFMQYNFYRIYSLQLIVISHWNMNLTGTWHPSFVLTLSLSPAN